MKPNSIPDVGDVYGDLTVISVSDPIKESKGSRLIKLSCSCGNSIEIRNSNLVNRRHLNCGCKPKQPIQVGSVFNLLTVLEVAYTKNNKFYYLCKCKCGSETVAIGSTLKNGKTKSCGCLTGEFHGLSESDEYRIWKNIKTRTHNKARASFKDYIERGIEMCPEWKESFIRFYEDMGPRPSVHHSIERIDNDKGYSKENCKWATRKEQNNNQRRNVFFEKDGCRLTLTQWSEKLGINQGTVRTRIRQLGWPIEKALFTKVKQNEKDNRS